MPEIKEWLTILYSSQYIVDKKFDSAGIWYGLGNVANNKIIWSLKPIGDEHLVEWATSLAKQAEEAFKNSISLQPPPGRSYPEEVTP